MKTRISLCIIGLTFLLASAQAWAGVDKEKLLGAWSGDLIIHFHGQTKTMKLEMTFKKDGKMTVKQTESGDTDEATFAIEGDKVLISDGKDKKMYLTNVKLTDTTLQGNFEAANESSKPPEGISLELSLTRGQSGKDKGGTK